MTHRPTLLLLLPEGWTAFRDKPIASEQVRVLVEGRDAHKAPEIDYLAGFRPPHGFLKTLPNLKAVFSLGAGVDGFLSDPDYPKHVPLVRFVDPSLAQEMAQYAVLHVLMQHRGIDYFTQGQREGRWAQRMISRRAEHTRIGILGLGEIGTECALRLRDLGFAVAGWSRTRKGLQGIGSFAGADELDRFLARSDFLVCVLPLTLDTRHILNAETLAKLPRGAYVINVARGGHLNEPDLVAALDRGHLSGATLDVFETEPLPPDSPLWRHPKVIVTPHVAAITSPTAAASYVLDGIARMERGEAVDNMVDLNRGY